MSTVEEKAIEILDIAKNIYQIQERDNHSAIIGNKTFLIGTESNPEEILVERDNEKKDNSYYFETPETTGVIIKRKMDDYSIKGCVKYTNANNQPSFFAKIRIEIGYDKDIKIMGTWGGSWQQPDFLDENQKEKTNPDFSIALESMKNHMADIYKKLCEQDEFSKDLYDPNWVKKIKKYNN